MATTKQAQGQLVRTAPKKRAAVQQATETPEEAERREKEEFEKEFAAVTEAVQTRLRTVLKNAGFEMFQAPTVMSPLRDKHGVRQDMTVSVLLSIHWSKARHMV